MRTGVHRACLIIGVLYAFGAFVAVTGLGWSWLVGRDIPLYSWWQWLLAPLAIGAAALAIEGLGTFVLGGFTFDQTESKARLVAGKVAFIVLLLVLLI
jgi:hypothetical protein